MYPWIWFIFYYVIGGASIEITPEQLWDLYDRDLSICPGCGGDADNGHDREYPPNVYYCTKCEIKGKESE